nr:serine/threonine-protein kinase [Deltaproteobacteria bacterium]
MPSTDVLIQRAFAEGRSCPDVDAPDASVIARRLFGSFVAPTYVDRFELGARLGVGGMGEVRWAFDPRLQRPVALKLLHVRTATGAPAARLAREACAMARLTHPNVVPIYDAGVTDGQPWLAMELIRGQTFAAWLDLAPSPHALLEVIVAIGQGLAAIHGAGLVHRDIKPSNVLIDHRGVPRVTDFGIARLDEATTAANAGLTTLPRLPVGPRPRGACMPTREGMPRVTATGVGVGTPGYVSPEQSAGGAPSAVADQYSYCVMALEALHRVRGDATSRAQRRIERVFERGLRPNAAQRWPTMDGLLRALHRARRPPVRAAVGVMVSALAIGAGLANPMAAAPPPPVHEAPVAAIASDPVIDAALSNQIARAASLEAEGQFERARQALAHPPAGGALALVLEHRLRRGRLDVAVGAFADAASELETLYFEALEVGHDDIAARAATTLVDLYGLRWGRLDDALRWSRDAQAVLARAELGLAARVEFETVTVSVLAAAGQLHAAYDRARRNRASLPAQADAELIVRTDNALLVVLDRLEHHQEALAVATAIVSRESSLHTAPHPHLDVAQMNLGAMLIERGDPIAAREFLLSAFASRRRRRGPDNPEAASLMSALGNTFVLTQDYEQADDWYAQALAVLDRTHASAARRVDLFINRGTLARAQGNLGDAQRWYLDALDAAQSALTPDHPHQGWIALLLGHTHRDAGRPETAHGYYRRAFDVLDDERMPAGLRVDAIASYGMSMGHTPARRADARR